MPDELANPCLRAALSDDGRLTALDNLTTGEVHRIEDDRVEIVTDCGPLGGRNARLVRRETGEGLLRYCFDAGCCDLELEYQLPAQHPWLKRRLTVTNTRRRLVAEQVLLGATTFASAPVEFVDYDTFWHAPTVAFLRYDQGGICTGIENPFFATSLGDGRLELSFAPGLILEPGQAYRSEAQFLGVYRRSHAMVADHPPATALGRRPRFHNPCGHLPLDRAEVRLMQRFAADYLSVDTPRFAFLLYNFFYPLPQMPAPGSPEEQVHHQMIDTFADLGGDLIIFNPMYPYQKPGGRRDAYWDLGPEGSAARAIMDHAERRGLGFGFYLGCARHGGEGNACALPFAPERVEWKKVDQTGRTAAENCMACDEFADWWHAVQRNTIERFRLRLWSWDPGPGNGLFCHSHQHGHLPGKGAYKGWRNAAAVAGRLKAEFPGLYLQAFYGRKEHGLWGFQHFDQHESYWEVSLAFHSSIHCQLHADRMNSDGIRQQAWWNQTFRFHPPQLSHSMTHRQQEGFWDPRLTRAWDHLGWRYSLMSTLAACGSVLVTILPEDHATVPGMRAFYGKWLDWARAHYDYLPYNVPFGDQVRPGGVDGWARLRGTHGFIFLCNPGPRPARPSFGLDDEIGLAVAPPANGSAGPAPPFVLKELYPTEGRVRADARDGRTVFVAGERVCLVVPAQEVVLVELSEALPATPPATAAASVAANAAAPPKTKGDRSGEQTAAGLPRALDDWRLADGSRFAFPRNAAAVELNLVTTFRADRRIAALLAAARPANLADYESLIPRWRTDYPDNFAWARPDRLWLVVPLVDAHRIGEVSLTVNGTAWPVACHVVHRPVIHFADLTDAVCWGSDNTLRLRLGGLGPDQFLGPYLDYPPADPAAEELAAETAPVVFDGPLDPEPLPRVPTGPADPRRAPLVNSVTMSPPYLREGQETVFRAAVDTPADKLATVYLSGPWHDVEMQFDPAAGQWVWAVRMGSRAGLIMDVDRYYVWAVAANGLVGPRRAVSLAWRF